MFKFQVFYVLNVKRFKWFKHIIFKSQYFTCIVLIIILLNACKKLKHIIKYIYKLSSFLSGFKYNFRLLWNISFVAFIYYTPVMITMINGIVNIPIYYYALLVFILAIHDVSNNY